MRLLLLILVVLVGCAHHAPATPEGTPQGLITIDVEVARVCEVLSEMARKSGANLIYSGNFSLLVNVTLKDVPWRVAVEAVAKSCDLVVDWETPGIVLVTER